MMAEMMIIQQLRQDELVSIEFIPWPVASSPPVGAEVTPLSVSPAFAVGGM